MTCDQFRELALSLPHTIASPHFERTAFKVVDKRIFATLHAESKTANVKFSPADQSVYCLIDKEAIYPVNNNGVCKAGQPLNSPWLITSL